MKNSDALIEALHDALAHLYEPNRLRENPLAEALGVANRISTFRQLQEILIAAIEALEPPADAPAPAYAWEVYEPLFYRYVKQMTQAQVAKQLGMSVRHLRRKEHAALEVLAANLSEQFELAKGDAATQVDETDNITRSSNRQGAPSVREELRWLRDVIPETPVSLDEALRETLALLEPTLAREGAMLQISLDEALPKLAVHSMALSQALLNLLCIIVRSAEGRSILISARESEIHVIVDIALMDAMLTRETLFEDDRTRLQLAEALIELSGGTLGLVQSDDGVTISIGIPSVGRVPVLVIDDNADTLQLLRRYAVGTRYRVFTSQDPEQALATIAAVHPEIVVLDVMMPEVDGWRLLGRLRQHPTVGKLPIIVCTVLPQREIAMDLGAGGFLQKPVTRSAFLSALDGQFAQTA